MDNLSKLSDTLKELIILNSVTESAIAENTGIPVSCISLYVRGQQAPYVDSLIKLADYFNCSVDYLLGRTDEPVLKKYKTCPPFPQRINELLEIYEYTSYKIYNEGGISKSSYYEWKRGKSLPTVENLVKLANVLNCSIDFVLGRED